MKMQFKNNIEVNKFNAACEVVRYGAMIAVITGEPGVGKTITAKNYAENDSNSIYIQLNPFSEKTGSFLRQLAEKVGASCYYMIDKTYISIKCCLSPDKFLIIDEADFLSDKGLNVIRLLWEETGCPIMLIGSNELLERMHSRKMIYFKSRVGLFEIINNLKMIEVQKIFDTIEVQHIKFIYEKTSGNLRLIDRLMNQVNRITELNKLPKPNKEALEKAARLVRVS
jgi:DNA transposition AAA+ family ATPase